MHLENKIRCQPSLYESYIQDVDVSEYCSSFAFCAWEKQRGVLVRIWSPWVDIRAVKPAYVRQVC